MSGGGGKDVTCVGSGWWRETYIGGGGCKTYVYISGSGLESGVESMSGSVFGSKLVSSPPCLQASCLCKRMPAVPCDRLT